jgi:hypothetical protein
MMSVRENVDDDIPELLWVKISTHGPVSQGEDEEILYENCSIAANVFLIFWGGKRTA